MLAVRADVHFANFDPAVVDGVDVVLEEKRFRNLGMEVKRVKKKLAVSSGSSSSSDRTYVFAAPVAAAGAGALRAAQRVGGVVLDAIEPDGDEAARVEPGHRGEVVVAGSWGGG